MDKLRRCDGYLLHAELPEECMWEINAIYFANERTTLSALLWAV